VGELTGGLTGVKEKAYATRILTEDIALVEAVGSNN